MSINTPSTQGFWEQLKTSLSRGITPYVLLTIYAVVMPILTIGNLWNNPRPTLLGDILFVLMLGTLLLLNRAKMLSPVYRWTVAGIYLLLIMPYFGTLNQFYMGIMIQIGMFVVLTIGLNVVVGFAGLLDLGYIAFYAVGAYLWAIFSTNDLNTNLAIAELAWHPLSAGWFFVFLPIALVVGAITGVLLGLPVLRLRGDYLAIVTLGFGEVIRVLATNLDRPINITNGAQGIKDVGLPPLILTPLFAMLGIDPEVQRAQIVQLHFYLLVLIVVGIMLLVVMRMVNSRIGRAWTAIREDETAALAMGVPLVRMKLLAFATGASFAGVMGMLFAAYLSFINPPTFDLIRSISILSMVILGGMGSVPGAILGATLVTLLNLQILPRITTELDRFNFPTSLDPSQYQRMIFGLLLIIMTIFRPQGILPEERRKRELESEEGDDIDDEIEGVEDEVPPTEPDQPTNLQK
jgi:branched-chain amino acid transport system permease protein